MKRVMTVCLVLMLPLLGVYLVLSLQTAPVSADSVQRGTMAITAGESIHNDFPQDVYLYDDRLVLAFLAGTGALI